MARILLAEDDEIMRVTLYDRLSSEGWEVDQAIDGKEAFIKLKEKSYHIVISDIRMPGIDGISLLRKVNEMAPQTNVILMTAYGGIENAIECLRFGAADYILKPFDMDDLTIRVNRLLDLQVIKNKCEVLEERAQKVHIVGSSSKMQELFRLIKSIANTESSVFISGESGTGKELVAASLHNQSNRSEAPYIRINCAAIPENLIESELFGYEKGAFTGAEHRKKGKFELADTGTILLDEIGDMPFHLQAKLLRVLEEREVEPIGAQKSLPIDVRIICSTAKDLDDAVDRGEFRMDLLYRLKVIPVVVPPLRERIEDLPELCTFFLSTFGKRNGRELELDPDAMNLLESYHFPGNIRELRNILERASVLTQNAKIFTSDLPNDLFSNSQQRIVLETHNLAHAVSQVEKDCIQRALVKTEGVRTDAAKLLGISRKNLWEKMRNYKLL